MPYWYVLRPCLRHNRKCRSRYARLRHAVPLPARKRQELDWSCLSVRYSPADGREFPGLPAPCPVAEASNFLRCPSRRPCTDSKAIWFVTSSFSFAVIFMKFIIASTSRRAHTAKRKAVGGVVLGLDIQLRHPCTRRWREYPKARQYRDRQPDSIRLSTFDKQCAIENTATLYRYATDAELTTDSLKSFPKIGRIADDKI